MREALILALTAVVMACTNVAPSPSPIATPRPSATPSVATGASPSTVTSIPSTQPTPELTAAPTTQAAIFGAVAVWIGEEGLLGSSAYVNETVIVTMAAIEGVFGFDADTSPELSNVGEPLFGPQLTPDSHEAISTALEGVAIEFVPDRQSAVDPEAESQMGCRPYLGGIPMVHLSGPLPGREVPSVFYVAVNIDRGCEGEAFLLDIRAMESGYRVLDAVSQSDWSV